MCQKLNNIHLHGSMYSTKLKLGNLYTADNAVTAAGIYQLLFMPFLVLRAPKSGY